MLNHWMESIKTVGIFLICAQVLIHFKPKGQYEKYIKLLISMMLLIQLMEPIGSLFGILEKGEFQKRIRQMEYRLSQIGDLTYSVEADAETIWDRLLENVQEELDEGAPEDLREALDESEPEDLQEDLDAERAESAKNGEAE